MTLITKGLDALARDYDRLAKEMRFAEARAVKRVSTTIRAQQSRTLTDRLNLRASTVKAELRVKQEPTASALRLILQARDRGVPLAEFIGTRQTRAGVTARVLKHNPRLPLSAAFVSATMGGHVFGRVGEGSRKYASPHVGRLPLRKLYGPSVASQYQRDDVQRVGADVWNTRLPLELEREVNFALQKLGLR